MHACLQAVSELLEQLSRQFAGSVKDILDPKKLSAGAGGPASSAEGPRAPHGSATSKWQVGVYCTLHCSTHYYAYSHALTDRDSCMSVAPSPCGDCWDSTLSLLCFRCRVALLFCSVLQHAESRCTITFTQATCGSQHFRHGCHSVAMLHGQQSEGPSLNLQRDLDNH